jgi:hypothetical protein
MHGRSRWRLRACDHADVNPHGQKSTVSSTARSDGGSDSGPLFVGFLLPGARTCTSCAIARMAAVGEEFGLPLLTPLFFLRPGVGKRHFAPEPETGALLRGPRRLKVHRGRKSERGSQSNEGGRASLTNLSVEGEHHYSSVARLLAPVGGRRTRGQAVNIISAALGLNASVVAPIRAALRGVD